MVTLSEANQSVLDYLKRKWGAILFFLFVSLCLRIVFFQFTSADLEIFLLDWFEYFEKVPLVEALKNPISNYTGPYTYLLFLSKVLQSGIQSVVGFRISDIAMIKMVNIPFELALVYLGMLVIRFYKKDDRSLFYAFALLLLHPILLINGAFWGQCDVIYTSFLAASFVMFLYKKDIWGLVFFSISVTLKFQAMFFSPVILALVFGRRIRWYWLGVIPGVYIILHLPSLIAGRSFLNVVTIYFNQADSVPVLTGNAPNLYQFIPPLSPNVVDIFKGVGLLFTILVALGFAIYSTKTKNIEGSRGLLLSSCLSFLLMPYVMPSMLDRYFFPAEIFLLILALVDTRYWVLPILVSSASILVYYNSYNVIDLGINALPSKLAAMLNLIALIVLLVSFLRKKEKGSDQQFDQIPGL